MYNITLLSSFHTTRGKCNPDELYKIIEEIQPEIIFEEIPPSCFDVYYVTKIRKTLESDTVNKYAENHNIQHIPIDSDNVPSESFFNDLQYLYNRIEGIADINGYNYRTFVDKNSEYVKMYGFQYLNSDSCSNIQNAINEAIEKGVQKINNEKLFLTLKQWKDVNNNRENEMIKNIYNYSKENQYNQAILLIGSGHRKSIIQKIMEYEKVSETKLNWTFF
jgi:hypothetical protein